MHYRNGDMASAMTSAVELLDASFVMLTMEYEGVHLWCDGEQHECVGWIASTLNCAATKIHSTVKCILFGSLTL